MHEGPAGAKVHLWRGYPTGRTGLALSVGVEASRRENMMMLKNAWYVAGWANEVVPGKLLGRTFLNEPVVMFRLADGAAVALSDVCPHRFAPLHRGKQLGNIIQCGYHGLEFDAAGRCVRNPHGNEPPSQAVVRRYPLVERYDLLWIWMGEQTKADESRIPGQLSFITDRGLAHNRLYLHAKANYLLMVDNLMDVSHALYLHSGSLTQEKMREDFAPEVKVVDGVTTMFIRQRNITPPPFWASAFPKGTTTVDKHETSWGYPPSIVVHEMAYSQPGRPPHSEGGASARGVHLYTPETDSTTHYFYSLSRDYHRDSAEVQERIQREVHRIFSTEDLPMIEAQQRNIGDRDLMSMRPALIPSDRASVLMRRQLAKLIAAESTTQGTQSIG